MKKQFLLASALIAFSTFSWGQLTILNPLDNSLHSVNDSTIVIYGNTVDEMNMDLYVINTGIDTMAIVARRDSISLPTRDTDNEFCWVLCYGKTTNISEYNLTLGKGDTANAFNLDPFQGHYYPYGHSGSALIRYTFYPARNHADSSWVIVNYDAIVGLGVNNVSGQNISFSTYPNPAGNLVNFSYSLKNDVASANLKIFNMLGECVETLPLNAAKNKTMINVQSMPSGVYVCEVEAPGCQPVYQKMIVSH